MLRPLVSYDDVSYDDISSPQNQTEELPAARHASRQKSPKKRKRSLPKHWDDHSESLQAGITYDEHVPETSITLTEEEEQEEQEEAIDYEESRELTYNEIWDDSALIDAWHAATAEYEAYHGDNKDWKKEPIVKSTLWYNVPPSISKPERQKSPHPQVYSTEDPVYEKNINGAIPEGNSQPSDFNTFVPNHDPSLRPLPSSRMPVSEWGHSHATALHSTSLSVTQDEAFNRALEAMYWSGYWTAAYHFIKNRSTISNGADDTSHEDPSDEDS